MESKFGYPVRISSTYARNSYCSFGRFFLSTESATDSKKSSYYLIIGKRSFNNNKSFEQKARVVLFNSEKYDLSSNTPLITFSNTGIS